MNSSPGERKIGEEGSRGISVLQMCGKNRLLHRERPRLEAQALCLGSKAQPVGQSLVCSKGVLRQIICLGYSAT